jgi:DNA ligase-1
MRREFLQLAKTFKLGKDDPSGMWASEKLDGTRAFWDGGLTRGLPTVKVPWANTINPKTGELKAKIKPVSTGLWSRYGNPIMAPDWWLNQLPAMFLDGELFAGRGKFQTLRSIVAKDAPGEEWREVTFAAFGTPSVASVFQAGEIKNPNFHRLIDPAEIKKFIQTRLEAWQGDFLKTDVKDFETELNLLQAALTGEVCYLHRQTRLPEGRKQAEEALDNYMDAVLDEGGEGIILRKPKSLWVPKRTSNLLKLKPFTDDKGTVTGFISGRETDKGSKLRGLIGALILDYNGKRLELSGFTDEERKFSTGAFTDYAYANPGEDMPANFQGKYFKLGDEVEFRYRELSIDGIPKEARYARQV